MRTILAPCALADALDRMSILARKLARVPEDRRATVATELRALEDAWRNAGLPAPATVPGYAELAAVNAELWDVEDRLRAREAEGDFGAAFVEDARSVYRWNDRRAAIKRALNLALGSALVEEKVHPPYERAR